MRIFSIILLIGFWPALVFAQGGVVCLYADVAGTDCTIDDTSPALLQIYVLHTGITAGATAVEFSAPMPSCMVGATWLTDSAQFPVTIGNSQVGVAIGYGGCFSGPVHVLTISYSGAGTSLPDCPYPVLQNPDAGGINAVDCFQTLWPAAGGTSYVNSALDCECVPLPLGPLIDVSPVSLSFDSTSTVEILNISNVGEGVLTWNVSEDRTWMSLNPTSGIGAGTVMVTVDRTGLLPGTKNGRITVTSNGGNRMVSVSMIVPSGPGPALQVVPTILNYGFVGTIGSLTFQITNAGTDVLSWVVAADSAWISIVPPTSGSGDATVEVQVDRTGLPPDDYEGHVQVTSNGGNATVLVMMSTRSSLKTHEATWGRIKALYR